MRNSIGLVILLISGLSVNSAFALDSTLSDLSWMVGQWECKADNAEFEEHWMRAAGDSMIGMGREVKDGKLAFHEYLRLEHRSDGIYYVAQPFGKLVTEYKLSKATPNLLVFENPDHDFPKKIEYSLQKDGSIFVTGSGNAADKDKEFRYQLTKLKMLLPTPEKSTKTEKPETTDKSKMSEKTEKAEKVDKTEKSDKSKSKSKAKSGRFFNPLKGVNDLLF